MHTEACSLREIDLSSSLRAFRTLPIGVTVWQLRDPNDLRSLRLIDANPAAEREFRAPLGFAVGKPIVECFPKLLDTPLPERCRRVVLSGKPETLGEFAYRDARIPEGVFWADVFPLPDRSVGLALENITERKRTTQNQTRALQLLHRVTVHLNEMPALLQAAQFCVDEICAQIGWPVGHFFLSDEACGSHFLPNPVWHLSDTNRFRVFRKATELFERDLTNKLALEYRTMQGHKAGLTRSVGFSVVESDFLRGVLEFSSESLLPLDEHVFRAIANVGFQLGQVFTRERLAREHSPDHDQVQSRDSRHVATAILAGETFRATVVTSRQLLRQTRGATSALSNELLESTRQMRQHLDEFKRLTAKPTPLLPNPTS
jgi:hypothetical protein